MNDVPLDNYYRWLSLTYVVTLATNPAISLPCGLDHKGMPFGMQIIAPFRQDAALLASAEQIEKVSQKNPGLKRPRPDLLKLISQAVDLKSIVTAAPDALSDTTAAQVQNSAV
ncbi:Acylamidase [compost metagenome]